MSKITHLLASFALHNSLLDSKSGKEEKSPEKSDKLG